MELIPIKETSGENEALLNDPLCRDITNITIEFYKKTGFVQPWIGYFAKLNGDLVGMAGFKGKPVNGKIEIAYGTFEKFQNQGVGTAICKELVALVLTTDPSIKITARTLPERNYSTSILEKNHFKFAGIVNDVEDWDVWEWSYHGNK